MAGTATLDLLMMDTHSLKLMAIGDASVYTNFNPSTPTIQITPPGFFTKTMPFTPGGVDIYNAAALGIVPEGTEECSMPDLPDGIYTFKYSVAPVNVYNVTKNFFRTYKLEQLKNKAFLKIDMIGCDGQLKRQQKMDIDDIEFYISGAIAAANECALKRATEIYNKAYKIANNLIKNLDCGTCLR